MTLMIPQPQADLRFESAEAAAPAARTAPKPADAHAVSVRSPARDMIEALEGGLSEPAPLPCEARWSPRLVTLSVLVFCGGFWIGAGVLLSRLF